ncbi:MAG: hypothetical protein ACI4I6_00335 [Hominimerdicola sp.]
MVVDGKYNVMIVNVSLFRKTEYTKEIVYSHNSLSDMSCTVSGQQTNEAAIKYVVKKLKSKNKKLDKIILLETNEVVNNPISQNDIRTTHTYLSEIIEKETPGTTISQLKLNDSKAENLNKLTEVLKVSENPDEINIYFDSTGGTRDVSDWIKMVVKFLEYSGYKIADVLYSDITKSKDISGNIYCVKDTLIDLINGAEEFTSTGRCDILYQILNKDNSNSQIVDLIKAMKEFSDSLLICQVNKIDNVVDNLKKKILQAEQLNSSVLTEEESLFKNLIPQIKEKLYLNGEINTLTIIKWCVENNLIQQALTIFESKIPQFILTKEKQNGENVFVEISQQNKKLLHEKYLKESPMNDEYTWIFFTELIDERINYGTENKEIDESSAKYLTDKLIQLIKLKFNSSFILKKNN